MDKQTAVIEKECSRIQFNVVVSCYGQYSLWDNLSELPPGWKAVGVSGSKHDCLSYIERTWKEPCSLIPGECSKIAFSDNPFLLHHFFERAAADHPDNPAIIFDDESVSYRIINERSTQLAELLVERGIGPDILVAIYLERSIDLIVCLLAILKAGGASLFIDFANPSERIQFILEDAAPSYVITTASLSTNLPNTTVEHLYTESLDHLSANNKKLGQLPLARPENLAYIIYTSGSTGIPKGVMIPHSVLVNLVNWQLSQCRSESCRVLQYSALSFDVSYQEIFFAFACGGTLVLVNEEVRRDPYALLRLVQHERVTHLFLPVVAFRQLAETANQERIVLPNLKEISVAGEQPKLTEQIAIFLKKHPSCLFSNQYGPSETHVTTAWKADVGNIIDVPFLPPIGAPLLNCDIHIVDDNGEEAPVEERGEIFIGGVQVGRGYLNRPALTAEKFVPNRFSTEPGGRLYKTGDRAFRLASGNIQFVGRLDSQVKVRGYRVELQEVELSIKSHKNVIDVVVAADKEGTDLVAFVVADSVDEKELRTYLLGRLPPYMVPITFSFVDSLPLGVNGKIDRQSLFDQLTQKNPTKVHAQQTATGDNKEHLLEIWRKLLPNRHFGLHDDFWDLSGDSIVAARMFSEIERHFGKRLPQSLLVTNSTVEKLAFAIERSKRTSSNIDLVVMQPNGSRPPLFMIHSVDGIITYYRHLVRLLGDDQPVWAIEQNSVDSADLHTTIQEIATLYISRIRHIRPHGPYYIAGHSYGGVIAYEMAQQLTDAGELVKFVGMIDSYTPSYFRSLMEDKRNKSIAKTLMNDWTLFRNASLQNKLFHIRERVGYTKSKMLGMLNKISWKAEGKLSAELLDRLRSYNTEALLCYDPKPYDSSVVYFLASRHLGSERDTQRASWPAKEQTSYIISGTHTSIIEQPRVQELAKAFREAIDRS